MRTVVESPNHRLRRELGLSAPTARRALRTGDWMQLSTGDRVRERDGRHTGRVEAINHGAFVVVRWHDNGWLSELPLGAVERIKEASHG